MRQARRSQNNYITFYEIEFQISWYPVGLKFSLYLILHFTIPCVQAKYIHESDLNAAALDDNK